MNVSVNNRNILLATQHIPVHTSEKQICSSTGPILKLRETVLTEKNVNQTRCEYSLLVEASCYDPVVILSARCNTGE